MLLVASYPVLGLLIDLIEVMIAFAVATRRSEGRLRGPFLGQLMLLVKAVVSWIMLVPGQE